MKGIVFLRLFMSFTYLKASGWKAGILLACADKKDPESSDDC